MLRQENVTINLYILTAYNKRDDRRDRLKSHEINYSSRTNPPGKLDLKVLCNLPSSFRR